MSSESTSALFDVDLDGGGDCGGSFEYAGGPCSRSGDSILYREVKGSEVMEKGERRRGQRGCYICWESCEGTKGRVAIQ